MGLTQFIKNRVYLKPGGLSGHIALLEHSRKY